LTGKSSQNKLQFHRYLFLTSDRYYCTLRQESSGFYDNPTRYVKSLFTETERIDSVETFSIRIGNYDQSCGQAVDLLIIYLGISF
jgi:hypothetical protein